MVERAMGKILRRRKCSVHLSELLAHIGSSGKFPSPEVPEATQPISKTQEGAGRRVVKL